jgi:hypothetical protein
MRVLLIVPALILFFNAGYSQIFTVADSSTFVPQHKKIILLKKPSGEKLILFKTNLAVNTDGIPISYHPYDLRGDSIALNSILNGIFVYRNSDGVNLSVPRPKGKYSQAERNKMASEAYSVIEKWRDSNYTRIPPGYKISWQSVLVASQAKPCIFSTGKYKGYFASATALTNHLTSDLGECNCNNQVDPFVIPALVLAKNGDIKNPVRTYGGTLGDLVLAYNPANKNLVYAIIGDTGPEDNLGEGSVILNMKLKGQTSFPATKRETYNLATDKNIMICILPNSNSYQLQRPYTQENIKSRIASWFSAQGYTNETDLIQFFENNKTQFK